MMKHYLLSALVLAYAAAATPLDRIHEKAAPEILSGGQSGSNGSVLRALRGANIQRRQITTNHFPKIKQYVTTHDTRTGKAVFSKALPETVDSDSLTVNPMPFTRIYETNTFPVNFANDADLNAEVRNRRLPDTLGTTTGSIIRFVDFAPASALPPIMHRTVTLDYAVVLEGTVELILDSGERRMMNRGDVAIQRGTMHAWRNPSQNEWVRLLFVLQASKPVEIDGESYGEALGAVPS